MCECAGSHGTVLALQFSFGLFIGLSGQYLIATKRFTHLLKSVYLGPLFERAGLRLISSSYQQCLVQESAQPTAMFANKALLEHRRTHSLLFHPWSQCQIRTAVIVTTMCGMAGPQNPLLSDLVQKKLEDPSPT